MLGQSNIKPDAKGLRIAIAVSGYHAEITDSMREAAIEAFTKAGGDAATLIIVPAAGAFELTAICQALARLPARAGHPAIDAIVAIGCVIAGETNHDQYLAQSVTQGLTTLTLQTGVPIAFGILTCQNLEQARARSIAAPAAGCSNKGTEAMQAAIQTVNSIRMIDASFKEHR